MGLRYSWVTQPTDAYPETYDPYPGQYVHPRLFILAYVDETTLEYIIIIFLSPEKYVEAIFEGDLMTGQISIDFMKTVTCMNKSRRMLSFVSFPHIQF